MREVFHSYLEKAKAENKLVAIQSNTDDSDKFSAGYIIEMNNDVIRINTVNPNRLQDRGFTSQTKDLHGIDYDDKYFKR